ALSSVNLSANKRNGALIDRSSIPCLDSSEIGFAGLVSRARAPAMRPEEICRRGARWPRCRDFPLPQPAGKRRPTEGRHERIASRKARQRTQRGIAGRFRRRPKMRPGVAGPPYRLENTPFARPRGASGMLRFIYAENAITIRLREGPRSCLPWFSSVWAHHLGRQGRSQRKPAVLRDESGSGGSGRRAPRNVLGEPLDVCSITPMTGFYRDGCCNTGQDDIGSHTVCAVMTAAFLDFSKSRGNDLSTPMPELGFPGLQPGD